MIDDDDDEGAIVFVTLRHETRLVRVIDTILVPSRLRVTAEIHANPDAASSELSTALVKIKLWMENIVSQCVAFSADNLEAIGMFFDSDGEKRIDNQIMLTPGAPTDDALASCFQAKMQAFAGDCAIFSSCEVKSDNMTGLTFTFVGNTEDMLPTMADWIGERAYFAQPWWNRDDTSTADTVPAEDADLSKPPEYAKPISVISSPLNDSVVLKPSFKPKIHDGGKPDA